jgi:hypothetical protein
MNSDTFYKKFRKNLSIVPPYISNLKIYFCTAAGGGAYRDVLELAELKAEVLA